MVNGVGNTLISGADELDLDFRSWGPNSDNVVFEMVPGRLCQSMDSFPGPKSRLHFVCSHSSVATGENDVFVSDVTSASLGATPLRPGSAHGAVSLMTFRTVLAVKSVRSLR